MIVISCWVLLGKREGSKILRQDGGVAEICFVPQD